MISIHYIYQIYHADHCTWVMATVVWKPTIKAYHSPGMPLKCFHRRHMIFSFSLLFTHFFFKTSIQNGGVHHVSYIHGMWLLSFAHIRFLTDPPWHLLVMLWIQTVTCIISPFCLPPSCEPSGCPCTALLLHLIPARWPQALLPNREPEHSQSTVKTDLDIRSQASLSQVVKTFC